jgi:hypothetical protein
VHPCRRDAAFSGHLASCRSLEALALPKACLPSAYLRRLAPLVPCLTSLDVSSCKALGQDFFRDIATLSSLRHLAADNLPIRDPDLVPLGALPSLASLDISFNFINGTCLPAFSGLTALRINRSFAELDARLLTHLTALRLLDLTRSRGRHLEAITRLAALTWLAMPNTWMAPDLQLTALRSLVVLHTLKLTFSRTMSSDDLLEMLASRAGDPAPFAALEALDLSACLCLGGRGAFAVVEFCPALTWLKLQDCHGMVDKYFVQALPRLRRLKWLDLSACGLSGCGGVRCLSRLSGLTYLSLRKSRPADTAMLQEVAHLTTLRALDISDMGCEKAAFGACCSTQTPHLTLR